MPKPKEKAKPAPQFKKGQTVTFDLEGDEVEAKITAVNDEGVDVVTEEGISYECEFSEITLKVEDDEEEEPEPKAKAKPEKAEAKPKKKKVKEPEPEEEEEEEEEETPKKKKGKGKDLASAWNAVDKADASAVGLPRGNWEALITGGECSENDKGISAFLEFTGVNDPDVDDKSGRKYYQLFDTEGEPLQGCGIIKRDLVDLGVDEDDLVFEDPDSFADDMSAVLKKLAKKQPWVSIRVVEGKGGYNNTYLQGLMPDQDEKPELPD